jgi:hypothetical protein
MCLQLAKHHIFNSCLLFTTESNIVYNQKFSTVNNFEFLFCSVVKNIVQNSSESVLHVRDHMFEVRDFSSTSNGREHAKPHFPLLL